MQVNENAEAVGVLICDLDGTLTTRPLLVGGAETWLGLWIWRLACWTGVAHRRMKAVPIDPFAREVIKEFTDTGWKVMIVTARHHEMFVEVTKWWLKQHGLGELEVRLRTREYKSSKDFKLDVVHSLPKGMPIIVIDDRPGTLLHIAERYQHGWRPSLIRTTDWYTMRSLLRELRVGMIR